MASVGAAFRTSPWAADFLQWILMMTKALMLVWPSSPKWLGLLVVGSLALCDAAAARAQQFSADLVIVAHDGAAAAPAGKLRVFDDKVRLETPELADGFFLIDEAKPTAYFVRSGARIFMDAKQSSRLTRLFIPVDPDAPCRQWQAMAHLSGVGGDGEWRCEPTGEEKIDGHNTVAFRAVSATGAEIVGWIDREHRFPLRIKTGDGTLITLEQIRDEPQPASSFVFPASYKKFSPEALIERIKQSDVWVSSPGDAESSRP
jgi:hypothetical protein